MSEEQQKNSFWTFWTTLPGILTEVAAVIAAIAAVIAASGAFRDSIETQSSPQIEANDNTELPKNNSESSPKIEMRNVEAKNEMGESYRNRTGKAVTINFTATGKWIAIPNTEDNPDIPDDAKGYISPRGVPNFLSNHQALPCPGYPLGALIVKKEKGECLASGDGGTFDLGRGETVYFLMNDVETRYDDNGGEITVQLSIE